MPSGSNSVYANSGITCVYETTGISEISTDPNNNTSVVRVSWQVYCSSDSYHTFVGSTRSNAGYSKVWVEGNRSGRVAVPLNYGMSGGNLLATGSADYTVAHNDDGSKTITYGVTMDQGTDERGAGYYWQDAPWADSTFTLTKFTRDWTVSYNGNGGSTPSSQNKHAGTNITLGSSSRTGYTFSYWNGSDGKTYAAGATFSGNYALALTAIWTANTYTISYNANGGAGAPGAQTKTYDSSLTLTTVAPSRTGYTFSHWNTASDNSGTSYNSGQSFTSNITSGITLYAIWTANTYTISYSANGGSNAPGNQTKTYDSSLTLTTAKPSRTGYTFAHWNTNADNTGTTYDSGATFSTNIISSITLYAIWSANSYTVTYDANGGTGAPSSQTKVYDSALNFSSTEPTKTLAIFASWNTLSNGSGTSYAPGASIPNISSNLTVYAIWTPQYEITYSSNTSDTVTNLPTKQIKTYNQNISLSSSVPVRNLYNFISWNTNSSNTGTNYSPGTTYSTNAALTLYAIWKLAYILPSFTNVPTAIHSDSTGKAADEGTYINATVKWSVDRTIDTTNSGYSIQIDWKSTESSTYPTANTITKTISGVSGTTNIIFGAGAISSEITYDIKISLLDSYSQSKLSSSQKAITYIQIQNSSYAFDIYKELDANNYHACIGGPARDANVIDIKYGGSSMTAVSKTGAMTVKTSVTAPTFNGALNGNATTATTASSCTGNSATATTATTASSCTGNAATATTAASCSGNAATATYANNSKNLNGVSNYARLNQPNNFIHDGNEVTFTPDAYNGILWFNYRTGGGTKNGNISAYYFGDGKGNYTTTLYAKNFVGAIDALQAYPVGAIYMSLSGTSPASLFGGTWTQITGRFFYATASSPGATGGSNKAQADLNIFAVEGNQFYIDHRETGTTSNTYTENRRGLVIGSNASATTWSETADNGIVVQNSADGTLMPPYMNVYAWRRTA